MIFFLFVAGSCSGNRGGVTERSPPNLLGAHVTAGPINTGGGERDVGWTGKHNEMLSIDGIAGVRSNVALICWAGFAKGSRGGVDRGNRSDMLVLYIWPHAHTRATVTSCLSMSKFFLVRLNRCCLLSSAILIILSLLEFHQKWGRFQWTGSLLRCKTFPPKLNTMPRRSPTMGFWNKIEFQQGDMERLRAFFFLPKIIWI
jgi:hypothetical protein